MIFDTHCHLNSEELYPNIDLHINNAKQANVSYFLVVGWDLPSSKLAIKIAEKYPFCYAAIGFHPCNIDDVTDEIYKEFETLLDNKKVVAIGEIGLDYHWVKDEKERNKQKEFFIKQINTANKFHKPIVIHNRDSINDCLTILKNNHVEEGGIIHCYSGSVENLNDFINLGFYISLGGPVTFTNAKTPKEVAEEVRIDRLVIETDCPYLAPHPLRGSINEPKNIALVLDEISRLRNISKKHLMAVLLENSLKCLKIKL